MPPFKEHTPGQRRSQSNTGAPGVALCDTTKQRGDEIQRVHCRPVAKSPASAYMGISGYMADRMSRVRSTQPEITPGSLGLHYENVAFFNMEGLVAEGVAHLGGRTPWMGRSGAW